MVKLILQTGCDYLCSNKINRRIAIILIFLLSLLAYSITNSYNGSRITTFYSLELDIDRLTPLVPSMIYVYISWYLQIALIVFLAWRNYYQDGFWQVVLVIATGAMALAIFIFLLFPTWCIRPDMSDLKMASSTEYLFKWLHSNDAPTNCWPSSHVLLSAIFTYYFAVYERRYNRSRWLTILFTVWTLAIWVSTVLIKQHFYLDVLAGISLAAVIIEIINTFKMKKDAS